MSIVTLALSISAENEALKAALDDARREKNKWFDIALERLGTIQQLSYELSVERNKKARPA